MIKLCARAYVYPSVATPLFIALWRCPKVTAISSMLATVSCSRVMTVHYMRYTCKESSQSQFHFLLSQCISVLGHETSLSYYSFFLPLFSSSLFSSFIPFQIFKSKPALGVIEIHAFDFIHRGSGNAIRGTLNGLRVCCQGDKANKLLCSSYCLTCKENRSSAHTFPGTPN